LNDGLRFGIGENDRGFVVHPWIDFGLDLLRDRRDGSWALSLHQPGDEVGSVAAEIEQSAAAI
jgi:hypothetical protein